MVLQIILSKYEDMLDEDTNAVECPECHNKISLDCDCGCDCESCGGSADGDSDSKKDK